ncbi:MAG: ABC transporter ATP-binding protein [Acholeplasmataceae bacterium]
MKPNEQPLIKNIKLSTWKNLFKVVLKNKKQLYLMIVFAVGLALLDTFSMILNQYAVDEFITSGNYDHFNIFIILNIVLAIFFGLAVYGFIYLGGYIESYVSFELREEAFKTLQRLSFSFYDQTPQGDIMASMTSDARRLSEVISWGLVDMVWSALLMIFTLIVLYIYYWKLALIVTVSLPLMFFITLIFRKKVLRKHRLARFYNSEITAKYNESFHGAITSKSLAIEEDNLKEFHHSANLMKKTSIKANSLSALFSSLLLMSSYVIVGLVMYFGSSFTVSNYIKIGTLFLFIRATMNFFEPVIVLSSFISSLQVAQASAERILMLIETKSEIKDTDKVIKKYGDWFNPKVETFEEIKGDVSFQNIDFYYKEDEIIFKNFNLDVKKGETVALVGHTGSGKTSLVNLLSRFYEPISGNILIDNIDYRKRSISWLHSQLGYVLQTPELFSDTIMENIRYGNINSSDEEVIKASKKVGLHDFIIKLENNYNTKVGEGGSLLSLGQRQLISFARAILANPKILILDEATSSIDSEAENIIKEATKVLLKGRTSFIVAHRLSTIVDSDVIVVLENGKIIEKGNHLELLHKKGYYYELFKNEFMEEKEILV